jgi:hypothetical protein
MKHQQPYGKSIYTLAGRIYELIPTRPEILQMDDPWRVLKIPGLQSDDLEITLMQVRYALAMARKRWREHQPPQDWQSDRYEALREL